MFGFREMTEKKSRERSLVFKLYILLFSRFYASLSLKMEEIEILINGEDLNSFLVLRCNNGTVHEHKVYVRSSHLLKLIDNATCQSKNIYVI